MVSKCCRKRENMSWEYLKNWIQRLVCDLQSSPQSSPHVWAWKLPFCMVVRAIFIAAVWLTLQSAEGQLWAILVCSTPISSQSFTPLLSSSMKNSALTSSPGKIKVERDQIKCKAQSKWAYVFICNSPWEKQPNYSPDLIQNSFSLYKQFFSSTLSFVVGS